MKILAFDTSNQPLSVAVVEDENILFEQTLNIKRNHSVQLLPAIEEALTQAGRTVAEMDRIAVADGPGSYTGLRIAITVAKSLAWAQDLELVGVSSLKVIAENSRQRADEWIVPLFDARRENIYTGLYTRDDAGVLVEVLPETHVAARQWAEMLAQKDAEKTIELIGADAPAFFELFQEKLGTRVQLAKPTERLPRASDLAYLAKDEKPVPVHTFAPTYLKLAEAEENWLKEHPDFKGGDLVEKI